MPFKEANFVTGFRSLCTHIVDVYCSTDDNSDYDGQRNLSAILKVMFLINQSHTESSPRYSMR